MAHAIDFDGDRALEIVQRLMTIPGASGKESRVAGEVVQMMLEAGLAEDDFQYDNADQKIPLPCEVGNLIVHIPAARWEKPNTRLFVAHLDTVELAVGARPSREGEWIVSSGDTALGADDRAGVAVLVNLAAKLLTGQLEHPPITLLFTIREEGGTWGARYVDISKLNNPVSCFSFDGSSPNRAVIGAPGSDKFTIIVRGKESHAGVSPEQGVSAIEIAAAAITSLREQGYLGKVETPKGSGTSNIGNIEGGYGRNVVMPELKILAETRSHDAAFLDMLTNSFKEAFEHAASMVKNVDGETGSAEFDIDRCYNAFRLSEDPSVVREAFTAIQNAGLPPETAVQNGGLDACWLNQYGIPTVTLGAGTADAHTRRERLHIPSYLKACEIALALATSK